MSASLIDRTTRILESEQEFWLVDSVSDGRIFQYVRVKSLDVRIPLAEIVNLEEIKNNLKAKGGGSREKFISRRTTWRGC